MIEITLRRSFFLIIPLILVTYVWSYAHRCNLFLAFFMKSKTDIKWTNEWFSKFTFNFFINFSTISLFAIIIKTIHFTFNIDVDTF